MKSRALALAALFVVAGCGGGGGGATAPQTPITPSNDQKVTTNLIIQFPLGVTPASAKARRPQYVSPNSTQIRVQVNTVNSAAPPSWVASDVTTPLVYGAGGNCTVSAGTATCTIPIAAPPGVVNYTITAEDAVPNALARKTQDVTIVQGTTNTPTVTLLGVVKTVSVVGPTLTANTSQTGASLTVSALDASGAQIVGTANFESAITLTDNDATGTTKLHLNGGGALSAVVTTKPGDAITIDYSGQATNSFTISASGTGITGGGTITANVFDVTFTGTTLDDTAHGGLASDVNWSEPTVFFSQASGSLAVSGAEVGFTNAPFSQQFDLDAGNGTGNTCGTGGGIATFSASPATTFTITATGVGVCKVRLKEHGTGYPITSHPAPGSSTDTTHDGTFWVSVTSAGFTVNGKLRHN